MNDDEDPKAVLPSNGGDGGRGTGAGEGGARPGNTAGPAPVGLGGIARQLGAGLASLGSQPGPLPPPPRPPGAATPPAPAGDVAIATARHQRVIPSEAVAVADQILRAAGHPPLEPPTVAAATLPSPPPAPPRTPVDEQGDDRTVQRAGTEFEVRLPDGRHTRVARGASVTIGRDAAAATLAIDNREISRRHVTITVTDDGPVAVDERSTNGTSVVRAGRWHDLEPGMPMALLPGDRLVVPDDIWLAEIVDVARARDGR